MGAIERRAPLGNDRMVSCKYSNFMNRPIQPKLVREYLGQKKEIAFTVHEIMAIYGW
jgi:hypothetical protein